MTYFDHTVGEQRTETAKYVFVCAGSVCSTEILLRSKARGLALSESLGSHFYANADSLAIAFDTDEPHEPSRGPTITTALVHEDEDPNGPWFMIQDGGYPQALTRAIGTFRARALLGRNAYPSPRAAEPEPVDPFRTTPSRAPSATPPSARRRTASTGCFETATSPAPTRTWSPPTFALRSASCARRRRPSGVRSSA